MLREDLNRELRFNVLFDVGQSLPNQRIILGKIFL